MKRARLLLVLLGAAVLPEFIVTDMPVKEVEGVNSYRTHRGFFGEQTVGQTLEWPKDITTIGVWLGRYARQEDPRGPVILRIRDAPVTGQVLREVRGPTSPIRSSALYVFRIPPIPRVAGKTLFLELHAPETTSKGALGARIDPNGAPSRPECCT